MPAMIRRVARAGFLSLPLRRAFRQGEPAEFTRAYAHCDAITEAHSKSFYFSTAFLDPDRRRAIRAFYAFCRTTDDLVDQPAIQISNLEAWRHASRRDPGAQTDPVLLAWADTRERYAIPNRYAEELIDGCEMDLQISRYETWEALRHYCYLVASTVGLISMRVIGMRGGDDQMLDRYEAAAVDLGVALQLTNILRDVGEDLGRGRVYLPQEDLRRFDYTEEDLRRGVIDARWRALMRFEIDRAEALYERGWAGIPALRREGRLAVAAAAETYRGILREIAGNDYDVFRRRARVSGAGKFARLPSTWWRVARAPAAE